MKWNRFDEKKPNHKERVLVAFLLGDRWIWAKMQISHPFEEDEKYHPDYYTYSSHDWNGQDEKIKNHWFWAYIEFPNKDLEEDK